MKEYSTEDKILALAAHLGFLTGIGYLLFPLIIWLVKKDSSRFVAMHAKQALVWQGACLVAGTVFTAVGMGISFVTLGLGALLFVPGMLLVSLLLLVPSVLAGVAVCNEKHYSYPVTGAYADKL